MKQLIRNKTFETNSSSVHSLAICKSNKTDEEWELIASEFEENIPLSDFDYDQILDTPREILSYLYSWSVVVHYWKLYDLIKQTFPRCIFEKPRYELPWNSKKGYCDDREITSFCEVINCNIYPRLNAISSEYVINHLAKVVFSGKLALLYDRDFDDYIDDNNNIKDKEAYRENFEIILI